MPYVRWSSALLIAAVLAAPIGCQDHSASHPTGRAYDVFPLGFANVTTIEQANAFFGAQPVKQSEEAVTWQVPHGPTMTFHRHTEGFSRIGSETNPVPIFDPMIQNSAQAKTAFGRDPDQVVSNKSLEMNIESFEINNLYNITFGFKSDGKVDVLIGGTAAARDAVALVAPTHAESDAASD